MTRVTLQNLTTVSAMRTHEMRATTGGWVRKSSSCDRHRHLHWHWRPRCQGHHRAWSRTHE